MFIQCKPPSYKPKRKKKKTTSVAKKQQIPFREMKVSPYAHLPSNRGSSVIIGDAFDTSKKDVLQYTGDKLIGISIVHKSCLQPVFSEEEAKDFSSMRR